MADQVTDEVETQPAAEEAAGRRPSSAILVRITVVLFLVAVVGTECLIASLWLPSTSAATSIDAAAEHSGKKAANATGHGAETPSPAEEPADGKTDPPEQVEIDLEQFNVTAHQPTSNTTMRIEFRLFGVISPSDKVEFEKLLKANHHRFREQVLVTLRSAEGTDLADAGLGLIKRQILEKTNALLGKPLLRGVIVSDFSYMEQ
jgi:flagellar basal body-associated protein FliL